MPRLGLGVTARRGASPALLASLPSLDLDFLKQVYQMSLLGKNFSDLITFSRPSASTRINPLGLVESVAANVPCIDHSPVNLATGVGAQTLALAKDRSYAITAVGGTVAVAGAGVNVSQMGAAAGAIHTPLGTGTVDVTFTPGGGVTALHVREVLGLGVWEQRTNLFFYSSDISNIGYWSKSNVTVASGFPAPDGSTSACLLSRNSTAGASLVQSQNKSASNIAYSASFFAKKVVGDYLAIRAQGTYPARLDAIFNLNTGVVASSAVSGGFSAGSATITPISGGWYRCAISFTTDTATSVGCFLSPNSNATVIDGTDSAANSAAYIWGGQLEAGAFASPYIPTSGAQVTRAADQGPINTLSPWFKSTEGAFIFEGEFGNGRWQVTGKTSYLDIIGTDNTGKNGFARNSAGNIVVTAAQLPAVAKMAVSWGPAGSKICVNGGAVQTGAAVPDFSSGTIVAVGRGFDTASFFNGHVRRMTFIKSQPSDAKHQTLTA